MIKYFEEVHLSNYETVIPKIHPLILHIPHSSASVPDKEGFIVDDKVIEAEILKLTDWHTDELFYSSDDIVVIAPFSRVFCDVERFADDEQEVMAQFGMGVLYEKIDDGQNIRIVTPEFKEKILDKYYWPHHKKLSLAVQSQLNEYGKATIIDCHSFPNIPFIRDLNKAPRRPDINIGTDEFHTPEGIIDFAVNFFESRGYSVGINWPFSGSIVPLDYYMQDPRVSSILIEVNRKLYLEQETNVKSSEYFKIKSLLADYLKGIRTYFPV